MLQTANHRAPTIPSGNNKVTKENWRYEFFLNFMLFLIFIRFRSAYRGCSRTNVTGQKFHIIYQQNSYR